MNLFLVTIFIFLLNFMGEGHGNLPQYSCLENPMDGGATVHGVARSLTLLSSFTFTFHFHALEQEMATLSSILAWRIPGIEEPGGHTWKTGVTLHQMILNSSSVLSRMSQMYISSVQSLSRVRLFATPWIAACRASLSITNSRSSLRLTSIELMMPSSHLILCRPLLLLPPIPPSIRVFSSESTLHMRCPEYWTFSFSILPSIEIPGLISFRMDWLDLLAVQGTLKSLLQHHSSKASILRLIYIPAETIWFFEDR